MMRVVRFLFWLSKIMKYLENLDNLFLLCQFDIIICFFILPLRKIYLLSHGRGKFYQNLREKFQGELGPAGIDRLQYPRDVYLWRYGSTDSTYTSLVAALPNTSGDKIALIGRNTPRWVMSFFATVTYGAIIVPILQDFNPNDVHHIITIPMPCCFFPAVWRGSISRWRNSIRCGVLFPSTITVASTREMGRYYAVSC